MTVKEFSDEFDTLLDSFKLAYQHGQVENIPTLRLDEYEKSVFLTQAQEDLVISLYLGKGETDSSYEETEELRRYLDVLNVTEDIAAFNQGLGVSDDSLFVDKPSRLLYITIERCQISSDNVCDDGKWIDVIPMRRDEFNIERNNPFKRVRVWRIDHEHTLELVPQSYSIVKYRIGYLRRPVPIVLEDFVDVDIHGVNTVTNCELNPVLHRVILRKAVQLAVTYMAVQAKTEQQ